MTKTIRTLAELQALRTFRGRRGVREVRIGLPGPTGEILRLEKAINRSLRACGCELGAVFAVLGMVGVVLGAIASPRQFDWNSARTLLWVTGGVAGLALVGKAIGLAVARRRLKRAVDEVAAGARDRTLCKVAARARPRPPGLLPPPGPR